MADKNHLVLTAIGPDRVGLVEKLSAFIAERGCNIEDSKMAVFCGEFAIIMLITGTTHELVRIAGEYRDLEVQTGLTIAIKTPASRKPPAAVVPYRLTVSCMDHPGIVHKVSRALSAFGINIESMETTTYAAPESGTPIFRLEARLSVPRETSIDGLRERFTEIQREESIDLELSPVPEKRG
ncbi:MAG TPA: ACT domain-containing protein [Candidatus Eisenbacteria bacterium]|nr:ACT domain-containing protein [Candidatus Eisenbacteria bacterium]